MATDAPTDSPAPTETPAPVGSYMTIATPVVAMVLPYLMDGCAHLAASKMRGLRAEYEASERPWWALGTFWLVTALVVFRALSSLASLFVYSDVDDTFAAILAYGFYLLTRPAWIVLLFGSLRHAFAFYTQLVACVLALVCTILFWIVDPPSGGLFLAVLFFELFLAALTRSLWVMNATAATASSRAALYKKAAATAATEADEQDL